MDKHIIRTSETDSVKGVASRQYLDVQLRQTAKSLPYSNLSATLSQRSVYEQERQAGNRFRLILTIVPYCTNVLFNPLTEIIRGEGSDSVDVVTDTKNGECTKKKYGVPYGKVSPTRTEMISDTEYSSESHGSYEYHPGYDFFDNHLLRNKSFKVVNVNGGSQKDVFNTLSDFTRDRNGNLQIFRKRLSINDRENINKQTNYKHLYMVDDILKIDESINQNLYEDNGWWGFTNNTTIDPKEIQNRKWHSMDIGKALNNHKACEFIDMYPDRSLFSFTPKFNKYTHKNEYNWNVVLTYPYKNIYDHPICLGGSSYVKKRTDANGNAIEETISEGNRWMGLKVMTAQIGHGKVGGNNIIFRTYTNHGLEQGDLFYLYYTNPYLDKDKNGNDIDYSKCDKFGDSTLNGNEIYYESENYHKVTNVGDLSRNNKNYYFYSSDLSLIKEIYQSYIVYVQRLKAKGVSENDIPFYRQYNADDKKGIYDSDNNLKIGLINKILKYTNFRIRRCVNGVKSTYYIRQFRKIPNLCAAKSEMSDEHMLHQSKFNGVFDEYISENALDPKNPKYQRDFKKETYQLAFSSNIFNDNTAQITFTDGIDTKGLTDNLGRPLSEIYYTVVKNNAGYEVWYDNDNPLYSNSELKKNFDTKKDGFKRKYGIDYDGYKIEYSHCFGKVTSGFDMFVNEDDTDDTTAPIEYWKKLSSVRHITNIVNTCSGTTPVKEDDISTPLDSDIKINDTFFYGDLVEFNPIDFKERQIAKVMHRFNTAQRETINNKNYSQYQYHEIVSDDYDKDNFKVTEYSAVDGIPDPDKKQVDYATISRPEGYYYQAHYPIQIREFTRIQQGSHYTIRVQNAKPVQKNGILIQVKTTLSHGLDTNDIIFICDDKSDIRYVTKCVQVINKTTFLMQPDYDEYIVNATDFEDKMTIFNIDNDTNRYKRRFSWLELCAILNGEYKDDIDYPKLILRRKNKEIPDYATYIGGNRYLWRNLINIGDINSTELDNYVFANGYFYITNRVDFFLKRQDPFSTNGLYFDGDSNYPCFPNDPSGDKQKENYYLTKETEVSC